LSEPGYSIIGEFTSSSNWHREPTSDDHALAAEVVVALDDDVGTEFAGLAIDRGKCEQAEHPLWHAVEYPADLEAVFPPSRGLARLAAPDHSHVVAECGEPACHLAHVHGAAVHAADHDIRGDIEDSHEPATIRSLPSALLSPRHTS